MSAFFWYAAWGLLPLVPAVLLYKVFPGSQASVSTPDNNEKSETQPSDKNTHPVAKSASEAFLQKLTGGFVLRLGGAVAVYFIVFYLMDPIRNGYYEPEWSDKPWELRAAFVDERGRSIPFSQIQRVQTIPNIIYTEDVDNRARFTLGRLRERNNKLIIPYSIKVFFANHEPKDIEIADSVESITYCEKRKDQGIINVKPLPVKSRYVVPVDTSETETIAERPLNSN